MSKPLSARQALVLRYVVEHPGATMRQVADALSLLPKHATFDLEVMYVARLCGRQAPLWGSLAPATWYAEPKGIEAAEAALT